MWSGLFKRPRLITAFDACHRWRAQTPKKEQDARVHKRQTGADRDKHQKRSDAVQQSRKKKPKKPPAPFAQRRRVKGRFAVPETARKETPHGFDPRLARANARGRRILTHVPVELFRKNEAALLDIVRVHIPQLGFGEVFPAQKFKARMALQSWMIDQLSMHIST